ncbi:MAG: DinB family protein [Planctomycetes bacterium]|nr:DinB family protein [Planctomycetota bacterium]
MADRVASVRESFRNWDAVRQELELVVDMVDAESFDWKPVAHENVKSIGDLMRHLCDSECYWIERVIQGKEWLRHTRDVWNDPDALLERWKILRRRTLQYLDDLSPARLTDTKIDHRGNIVTIGWILWHVFEHEAHHRGQIYMILRLRDPSRPSLLGRSSP